MANAKFAWGIDIGNRALKAIKLVRDGDSLRMEDIEVIEHEQVLSISGDNRDTLIQTALANFAGRHMTKGGVVGVGVSGQSSFARFIKLPPVEKSKIPEIVKFEAIQQIPFPLDDVEWSYQLFEQEGSPDVEVGIFAMRKELVNQRIKFFTDMDMNVQLVQMNPLAVYNAMYYDNRLQDGTTMILDLGAENADLIIADRESVWLRSVPIGGNNFTEALVKAFKLNFAKAEDLKRNAQTSKYARQIFQAMRPIFADLVAEIQRSIGFYSSVHRDSRIKRIIALGNTFRLPTLQKYLHQNLQIEVERLDNFGAGAPDDGRLAAVLSDNIASMAGAYGLALQAMNQGKITSSLLPHKIQVEKIWKEKTKWFAGAAALFVAAAGLKYGVYAFHDSQYESSGAKDARATIAAAIREAEKNDKAWQAIETSGGADKIRITNVSSLANYRDLWADLWIDVTRNLPSTNSILPSAQKTTARAQREQIFIESVASQYQPDIGSILKMEDDQFKNLGNANANAATVVPFNPVSGGGRFPRGGGGESNFQPVMPGVGRGFQPAPRPAETDPNAVAGVPTDRGYLLTLRCVSPYNVSSSNNASVLVDKYLQKLLADVTNDKSYTAVPPKPYYIGRAKIVSAQQLKNDTVRMTALKAAFDQKKAAKAAIEAAAGGDPNAVGAGGVGAGGGGVGPGAFRRPGGGVGEIDMGRRPIVTPGGGGGGGFGRNPNPGGTSPDDPSADPRKDPAFEDPLYPGENMLEDWDITVVIAVVLDPKPPVKAESNPTADATLPGSVMPADPSAADRTVVDRNAIPAASPTRPGRPAVSAASR